MKKHLLTGLFLIAAFAVFTILVCTVDVSPIGRMGSDVGFSALNSSVNSFFGQHEGLYDFTEKLGYTAFLVIGCFGLLGIYQLITRKSLFKVDRDIIALGIFYIVVLGLYVLFEKTVINYRPPFMGDETLEASYPSSHTLLMVSVMATAIMQIINRFSKKSVKILLVSICAVLGAAVIIGRMCCGVHWFTDIIAGVILAAGLSELYLAAALTTQKK